MVLQAFHEGHLTTKREYSTATRFMPPLRWSLKVVLSESRQPQKSTLYNFFAMIMRKCIQTERLLLGVRNKE